MMFNSNLTSSLSGWFTSTFQSKSVDGEEIEDKHNVNERQKNLEESKEVQSEDSRPSTADGTQDNGKQSENDNATISSVLNIDGEQMQKKLSEETQKIMMSAKSFGSYLFEVASDASKKVSHTVNETASTLKKTVEVLEEKTILGDLNREQENFIQKKHEKPSDEALPPWCGYHEEEAMKQQILALSSDTRNFLRSPPAGVQFQFDFDLMFLVALATLKEDDNLQKMRFHLVPTRIKEEVFWRNYFYRVSLIKQSAQLSTLSEMQKSIHSDAGGGTSESSGSSIVIVGSTAVSTMSRSSSSRSLSKSSESLSAKSPREKITESCNFDETSDELPATEFASDAFDPSSLNPDDLEREMKELGMNGEGDEIPEWEHELQRELQDYEIVQEAEKDELWEKEIDNLLTGQDS